MISSSRRAITQTSSQTKAESTVTQEQTAQSFVESFSQTAPGEVTRAVGYSALAGLTATTATHALSLGSLALPSARILGIGAAAGAAVGIAVGLGLSIFRAASSSGSAIPSQPVEPQDPVEKEEPTVPEPAKPIPTPSQLFSQDSSQVGAILNRRVGALASLIEAEKVRSKTLNRRGNKAYQQAKNILEQAGKEMPKQRPSIVKLEKQADATQKRLAEVRQQEVKVLGFQVEADKIGKESLGRRGRFASQESERLLKDLGTEAKRLTEALNR